jgi:NADH-quinone oxidoreductase subunit N
LLGAFSFSLILFGISQIYGLLGTTRFEEIGYALMAFSDPSMGLVIGFVLLISGLGFKLAIVPFHMWAPDAYEGAPFPVTAWLSIGSKAAALALVLRLLVDGFVPAPGVDDWQLVLVVLAALTMVIGNLSALVQKNVRRLLAYSSIGHVGYLLMGAAALVSVREDGSISTAMSHLVTNGIIFHIVAYGVTNLAAFTSLIAVYNHTGRDDIAGLAGLSARQPLVALVLVRSMFSLAGLPVFAGFARENIELTSTSATSGCLADKPANPAISSLPVWLYTAMRDVNAAKFVTP